MHYLRLQKANIIARRSFIRFWKTVPEKTEWASELGRWRKTRVVCSCPYCCGNPRKAKGYHEPVKTVQERKAPNIDDFEF